MSKYKDFLLNEKLAEDLIRNAYLETKWESLQRQKDEDLGLETCDDSVFEPEPYNMQDYIIEQHTMSNDFTFIG
jgi:hypothetical protein